MGQLSLILVVGAFLLTGIMVFNANGSAANADERVWEHQYHALAREAASEGMGATLRQLAAGLNTPWSGLSLAATDVAAAGGGTFTVEALSEQCSAMDPATLANLRTPYTGSELIEVRVTGTYANAVGADAEQSHQIVGCYLQADWNDPTPPSFLYAFISNDKFVFKGGPEIQAYLDGEGNVHSNETMYLGPKVVIDGHATLSDSVGSESKTDDVSTFGYGPEIPMVTFDPEEFRIDEGIPTGAKTVNGAYRYDAGSVTVGSSGITGSATVTATSAVGGVTKIKDPDNPADYGKSDPYIWFVDGDLTINGNAHLQLPGHTIIMVTGTLNVQGGGNVTVTGDTPKQRYGNNPTEAETRTWVGDQLLGGQTSPLGWYVDGDGLGTGTTDVILGGGGAMVGNIYTNGDFIMNGGGGGMNLVGSVAAYGTLEANGGGNGNNFWFIEVGQELVIPGVLLPGKQIIRLAFAEWTDPVLDNTPAP